MAGLLAALIYSGGCGTDVVAPASKYCATPACNTPYGVIQNFRMALIQKDTLEIGNLVARDFVFRFLPDPIAGRQDSLTRAEFLRAVAHLLVTGSSDGQEPPVSRVSVTMDTVSSAPDWRDGHLGWIRYIVQTHARFTLANGNQATVDSPAWWFFHQESGSWRLGEWQDQPSGFLTVSGQPRGPLASKITSWGAVFNVYGK